MTGRVGDCMRSAIEREKKQARGIVIRHGAYTHEASAFLGLSLERGDPDEEALLTSR